MINIGSRKFPLESYLISNFESGSNAAERKCVFCSTTFENDRYSLRVGCPNFALKKVLLRSET